MTDRTTSGDAYDGVALHDPQMLEEIELLGDLIVIATGTARRLSQDEIDAALGLVVPAVRRTAIPCV